MSKLDPIIENLSGLTLQECAELVGLLEEKWGVSAAAVAAGPAASAGDADGAEEKTEFDVILVKGDASKKMQIIKALRAAVSGLGLKEAKEMAEGSDVVVKSGVSKQDAESLKKSLEESGAEIKLA